MFNPQFIQISFAIDTNACRTTTVHLALIFHLHEAVLYYCIFALIVLLDVCVSPSLRPTKTRE